MYRETWASINLDALSHNVKTIENATQKSLVGVIKANAYGHGDIPIARHLVSQGIAVLGVSSIDEAQRIVDAGIKADILIFSYVDPSIIEHANNPQFIYTIPSFSWYQAVEAIETPLRLHLEINVGMNRYGVKQREEMDAILKTHHSLEGVYVHLQNPDNLEVGTQQINTFLAHVEALNYPFDVISVGNAPTSLIKDNTVFTHVRMGIGMYGYRNDIDNLQPILSLYSRVLYKEHVKKGESIGYDYDYQAEEDHLFGTIPIGYADGFDMRNRALPLYINNQPAPILGKICMDQTMIRIRKDNDIRDVVEIIGPNRRVPDIAKAMGVSNYVVITPLAPRIQRRYTINNICVETLDR